MATEQKLKDAEAKTTTAAANTADKTTDAAGKLVTAVVSVDIDAVEPYVCCGTCCDVQSIGLNYPSCIGCSAEGVCCACIVGKADACKPPPPDSNIVCLINAENVMCIKPGKTLCKSKQQFFCCEYQCACPCDSEVPFNCTICFVQIWKHDEFTTAIKPEIKVLPRCPALKFAPPVVPEIARD